MLDQHAKADPELIVPDKDQYGYLFKKSHPSLILPKHDYCKYKMKDGRDRSGLNIIEEKPFPTSNFAIVQ